MLSPIQKASILRRSGVDVPCLPDTLAGVDRPSPDDAQCPALAAWVAAVERLFVSYVAARAARSLRDAEEARQLERLRRMAATPQRGRRAEWAA